MSPVKLQICLIKNHFLCFFSDILDNLYIHSHKMPKKKQQKSWQHFWLHEDEVPEGTAMCILSNKIFGSRELRKVTYPFRSNCPLEFCKCAIAWYTSCRAWDFVSFSSIHLPICRSNQFMWIRECRYFTGESHWTYKKILGPRRIAAGFPRKQLYWRYSVIPSPRVHRWTWNLSPVHQKKKHWDWDGHSTEKNGHPAKRTVGSQKKMEILVHDFPVWPNFLNKDPVMIP